MSKIKRVRYFTKEKLELINPKNKKMYDRYLRSNINKNSEVENTTFKVYQNNMNHFMVYLAENWDNVEMTSDEFMEDALDIMDGYIDFCRNVLHNNKKTINNKLASVSSFYFWSAKRRDIKQHPFDGKLERMKGAQNEEIIASHYLEDHEIEAITEGLKDTSKYDIQDRLIWHIMLDSGNRVGAISKLNLKSLDIENMLFHDIREKIGYRVEVMFDEESRDLIEEWLKVRESMDNLECEAFFITKHKGEWKAMDKATIQYRVKKMGEIIGLDDFRSHSIRKTSGNRLYKETGNMELASRHLNHKSIDTTKQSYIKKESKANFRDEVKQAKAKKKRELEEAKKNG